MGNELSYSKATYCTGAQDNCRIRDWFLTQCIREDLWSSTPQSEKLNSWFMHLWSCFRPCPPTVHNAIVQSISWETRQLLHLRILLFLSLSLIMHVARASVSTVSTVNLKTHKASQSTWQLQAAHISLAPFSQTWSSNWEITPYPACPTLSITEFTPCSATCSVQRQQHADSEQTDGEKSMRGANIYKPPRYGGGSVVLSALNSASDVCSAAPCSSLPPPLSDPPLFHPLPSRTAATALWGGLKAPKGSPQMCGLLFLNTSMCTLFNVPVNTKVPFRSYPERARRRTDACEPEEVVIATERRFRTSGCGKSPEHKYCHYLLMLTSQVYTDKSNIHFNGMRLLDAFNWFPTL